MLSAQSFTSWRSILVDDGCSDNTTELLLQLIVNDDRFNIIHSSSPKHGFGPGNARNLGLAKASSPLVAFCDIDDVWHPDKLSLQVRFHITNNLDVSTTAFARFSTHQRNPILSLHQYTTPLCYNSLLKRNCIPMSSTLISTQVLVTTFKSLPHEDYCFWLETFKVLPTLRAACLKQVLLFYRVGSSSLSSNKVVVPWWVFNVYVNSGFNALTSLRLTIRWLVYVCTCRLLVTSFTHRGQSLSDMLILPPIAI